MYYFSFKNHDSHLDYVEKYDRIEISKNTNRRSK